MSTETLEAYPPPTTEPAEPFTFRCTCKACDCQAMLRGVEPRVCAPCGRGRHFFVSWM